MAEALAASAAPSRAVKPKRLPWDQRPQENDLWYARFLRFVALGPSRSMSLVTRGRRNAYPVPAHWPMQAKQMDWQLRAKAFDEAAKANPAIIPIFNNLLASVAVAATTGSEPVLLRAAVDAGGYQAPPDEEDYDETDIPTGTTN